MDTSFSCVQLEIAESMSSHHFCAITLSTTHQNCKLFHKRNPEMQGEHWMALCWQCNTTCICCSHKCNEWTFSDWTMTTKNCSSIGTKMTEPQAIAMSFCMAKTMSLQCAHTMQLTNAEKTQAWFQHQFRPPSTLQPDFDSTCLIWFVVLVQQFVHLLLSKLQQCFAHLSLLHQTQSLLSSTLNCLPLNSAVLPALDFQCTNQTQTKSVLHVWFFCEMFCRSLLANPHAFLFCCVNLCSLSIVPLLEVQALQPQRWQILHPKRLAHISISWMHVPHLVQTEWQKWWQFWAHNFQHKSWMDIGDANGLEEEDGIPFRITHRGCWPLMQVSILLSPKMA